MSGISYFKLLRDTNTPTWLFVTSSQRDRWEFKQRSAGIKQNCRTQTLEQVIHLSPNTLSGCMWGATIAAPSEKLGSQEGAQTNKWESEVLLFKVHSNVNAMFSLMPTFSNTSKAFWLSALLKEPPAMQPSPPGPSTTWGLHSLHTFHYSL